jgi:methionyl-tRNA formyltransferase
MTKKLQIVFFGTPDFAVPTLTKLSYGGYRVSMVVTQPDRPKGRGQKILPTPVKKAALEMGLTVYQPKSVNTSDFYEKVLETAPDYFVVVAFGQIFSEKLLKIPIKGAINVHASLLPKYRGAAPIQWALINGEEETGVTTMLMEKKMDAGDILLTCATPIESFDNAGTLHDRLADIGSELLLDTLTALDKNEIHPKPQDHSRATYAPMLKKENSHIDWKQPHYKIENLIRAMAPNPGAFTFHENKRLKIFKAISASGEKNAIPGTVLKGFENEVRVASGENGALSILEIQGGSGKRMKIKDFLRGNSIPAGSTLS